VKYIDPDGKAFHIIAAAIIGGGLSALKAAYNGKSGREIAAAAVGGAVFGGMVAATGGLALGAQLAGGAMAGTAAYLAENVVAGNESTLGGAAISTVAGTSAVMTGKIFEKAAGMIATTISKHTENIGASDIVFSDKFSKPAYKDQVAKRGWTIEKIANAINNPLKKSSSINKATGNSVTRYYVDDVTKKIIQVADMNKDVWK